MIKTTHLYAGALDPHTRTYIQSTAWGDISLPILGPAKLSDSDTAAVLLVEASEARVVIVSYEEVVLPVHTQGEVGSLPNKP